MNFARGKINSSGDEYVSAKSLKIKGCDSGDYIELRQKQVIKNGKEVRTCSNLITKGMTDDDAIRLRDALIEQHPIKPQA